MSTKSSPNANARQVRTKDKLKHSRNETRRRARIRDQFDHLKQVIECDKKDRYNILQYAVEVVQGYQMRVAQLESAIVKYESLTKQRFFAAPLSFPSSSTSSPATAAANKRARLEATKRARRGGGGDDSSDEEDGDDDEEVEDHSDEDEELIGATTPSGPNASELRAKPNSSHSVGIAMEPPTTTVSVPVTSGTNAAAVNVLATLASAATAGQTTSTTLPSVRVKVAKRISPKTVAGLDNGAYSSSGNMSTGSGASKKRKLDTNSVDSDIDENVTTTTPPSSTSTTSHPLKLEPMHMVGLSPLTTTTTLSTMPFIRALPTTATTPVATAAGGINTQTQQPQPQQPQTTPYAMAQTPWYGAPMTMAPLPNPQQQQQQQDMQKFAMQQQQKFLHMQQQQQQQQQAPFFPTPYFAPSGPYPMPMMSNGMPMGMMPDYGQQAAAAAAVAAQQQQMLSQQQQQQQQSSQPSSFFFQPTQPTPFNPSVAAAS